MARPCAPSEIVDAAAALADVELKPSDASGNPYRALAALFAAGLAGIEEG